MSFRQLSLKNGALVIIDWQGFFVDPSSPAFVASSFKLTSLLRNMIGHFFQNGCPVYASRHYGKRTGNDPFFRFYGRVLLRTDPFFKIGAPINAYPGVSVYDKNSYSLFENKDFLNDLKKKGINALFLAGLLAEKCLLANAFAAFDKGFDLFVIEDLAATREMPLKRSAMSLIGKCCGTIIKSPDLIKGSKNG